MGAPAKATCTVCGPSITGLYVQRNVLSPLSSRVTSTVSRRPCGSTITTATSPLPAPAKDRPSVPTLDTHTSDQAPSSRNYPTTADAPVSAISVPQPHALRGCHSTRRG